MSQDAPTPFIVGNLLPYKGKIIVAGPPKANKSWVCLSMALDIARGRALFDAHAKESGKAIFPVYKRTRVLYFEWELGHQGVKDRMKGLLPNPEDALGIELYFRTRDVTLRMDTEEGRGLIEREVSATEPGVLVMDPLAKSHGLNEDSSSEMGSLLRFQDYLVEKYGVSIITVHHTAKPNFEHPRRGGDRLRGSSAIFGDCDGVVLVNRKSEESAKEPILELSFELRRSEPMQPKYVRRLKNGEVVFIGDTFTQGV